MADVEQPGMFAGPGMFGHDAFILDGHMVARKADHARTLGTMPGVERQVLQRQFFFDMGDVVIAGHESGLSWQGSWRQTNDPESESRRLPPPLSRNLRALTTGPATGWLTPSVGRNDPSAFQSACP